MSEPKPNSHAQILKSSALIGSSSALNMGIQVVRGKAMALMLEPVGFGLFSILWNISELARTLAGMGINASGVRQIAEAVGTGDERKIARTVTTLRRVSRLLGVLGALLLLALCVPVSWVWFEDLSHWRMIALLSVAVLFGAISQAQIALIQGMRRVRDLARNGVYAALAGTICSIAIVYFFGEAGVAPALVCSALIGIATSWYFSRQVRVQAVEMSRDEVQQEASALLKLGFVFMTSSLLTTAVASVVQLILLRTIGASNGEAAGKAAVGCYQAAWMLGGYYVTFILQAMGADFYPRLTAASKDHAEVNRLVNEQAEVSLLLAGPGMLATLTFAPLLIELFTSDKFLAAAEVLRWICLGMMLRVLTWPIGFIIVAVNAKRVFFWSEVVSNSIQIAFVWIGVKLFGLNGAGIGFFAMYVVQIIGVYVIARKLTNFRWSSENLRVGAAFFALVAGVFIGRYFIQGNIFIAASAALTLIVGFLSVRKVCSMLPLERFPGPARKLLLLLRLANPPANA